MVWTSWSGLEQVPGNLLPDRSQTASPDPPRRGLGKRSGKLSGTASQTPSQTAPGKRSGRVSGKQSPDCFPDWFLGTSLDTTPDLVLTQVWVASLQSDAGVGGSNPCWCLTALQMRSNAP